MDVAVLSLVYVLNQVKLCVFAVICQLLAVRKHLVQSRVDVALKVLVDCIRDQQPSALHVCALSMRLQVLTNLTNLCCDI